MNNIENGDEDGALKNLERARKRLRFVQERVSVETSEEVMASVDEVVGGLDEGVSDDFDLYKLEEEKTGLVAELVVKVDGDEGQTLTREMVKDNESGENKVEIVVEGDGEQDRVVDIQREILRINNEIKERVVDVDIGVSQVDSGNVVDDVVLGSGSHGDSGGGNDVDDGVDPGPQGIVGVIDDGGDVDFGGSSVVDEG